MQYTELSSSIKACTRCPLHLSRIQAVLGAGNIHSGLVLIGEAPGEDEDNLGTPFVGKCGRLLDDILRSVGIRREEIYISNVVKCRPPNNRPPAPEEAFMCSGHLAREIRLINPLVIVTLGATSTKTILGTEEQITKLRGKVFDIGGIKVIPSFHPSYILRQGNKRKDLESDLLLAKGIAYV